VPPLSPVLLEDEALPLVRDGVGPSEMRGMFTPPADEVSFSPSDVLEDAECSIETEQPTAALQETPDPPPVEASPPPMDEVAVPVEELAAVTTPVMVTPPAIEREHSPAIPALEIKVESFGEPHHALSPTVINESLLVAEEPTPLPQLVTVITEPPASAGLSPESVLDYYQYLEEVVREAEIPEQTPITAPVVMQTLSVDTEGSKMWGVFNAR